MATVKFEMPTDLVEKISKLGDRTDEICGKALNEAAKIVEKKVAESLKAVIGKDTKRPSRSTGELQRALGVSPVKIDRDGIINIKVGFVNERSDKKSNVRIANVIEHGKHGQPPKPFMKPGQKASKAAAMQRMAEVLEEEMNKL